jgi:uncharacterized membrane protein YccC
LTARDPTREPIGLAVAGRVVAENRRALAREIDALDADARRLRQRGNPGLAADLLALRERLRELDALLARPIAFRSVTLPVEDPGT